MWWVLTRYYGELRARIPGTFSDFLLQYDIQLDEKDRQMIRKIERMIEK